MVLLKFDFNSYIEINHHVLSGYIVSLRKPLNGTRTLLLCVIYKYIIYSYMCECVCIMYMYI